MNVSGRKALVFGGSSGIGLATAAMLAARGARVVALSRRATGNAVARETLGSRASFVDVDVLDREGLARVFAAEAPFDVLINAATGGERATGPFLSMDLDGFQGSFRKLWGYVASVRLGAPHLSSDGAIVLVSGAPARKAPTGYCAISTVGNAVEGFARAIAPELAPRRINVVSPGIIDTPMFAVQGDARDQFLERATAGYPIKRPGRPEEVASAILLAVENDFMTGATIDVDGGMLLP